MSENIRCKVAQYCGGCQLQHLSYDQQLQLKQRKMDELFKKIHTVNPIIGMDNPYRYRNKVQVAFGYDRGRVLCGNYVVSTHKIVDIKDCMLADERAQKIINTIKRMAVSFKLSIFDEDTYKGFLRHVLIRTAKQQIMVVLVTGTPVFPKKKDFIRVLLEKHPEITTIVQCVNNKHTSMVLSDNCSTIYGKGYIEDQLCGKTFRLSANSFYQINRYQTEVLYSQAINMAGIDKDDVVIDAYCGIGTIGMAVADYAKEVIGVEINKQAIADAKTNAKLNGIDNISFVCADAGKFMQSLNRKIDVVIMDPARAGADGKFLQSLVRLKPKKIVYISCNPITQKDNLIYLQKNGYAVRKIQPVDMFPFTEHCETVCLLKRK